MSRVLHRRLDRLAQRHALSAGRWIVVEVHDSRVHDDALLDATLAVAITRYAPDPAEPPCALVSVTALHPARRGAMR